MDEQMNVLTRHAYYCTLWFHSDAISSLILNWEIHFKLI